MKTNGAKYQFQKIGVREGLLCGHVGLSLFVWYWLERCCYRLSVGGGVCTKGSSVYRTFPARFGYGAVSG